MGRGPGGRIPGCVRHNNWSKWAEVFRTMARISLDEMIFLFVVVELCTVLESEDTGSDVFLHSVVA